MIIGEGPGYYEDQQGRPFVGPAGRLLEELLASIGMKREDVYITNMIKCRAPSNRDPLPSEIKACKPYLDRQLELIGPRVVVTLGRYSFAKFFPDEPIGKARGRPRRWNGLTIYPMYHPAAALRNGNLRSLLEKDFLALPSILDGEPPKDEKEPDPEAKQLGLSSG
jgi:DNA polymerase